VTKIERSALCVHGHFSQPPRGNPHDATDIGHEADATPQQNWNERIHQTAYKPNADIGNFEHISFSFSQALLAWLERYAPETYSRIVEADKQAAAKYAPGGNALATAYNHVILPLARKRDKRTQIIWGIAAFERHYGRKPLGFWLPEMAVDVETLSILAEVGINYTLLASKQVQRIPPAGGAGPYRVDLPGGKSIAIFTRDDTLSSEISFNIHNLGGAGYWGRQVLAPARKQAGPLTLLATAGETFGHHFAGEEQFLHWLVVHEAKSAGYEMTTLDRYYLTHLSTRIVQIEERSTWGDKPGLSHWATGYADSSIDTTWKGALRRALDNAASDLDRLYEELFTPYQVDPWELRNRYLPALLAGQTADDFITEHAPKITSDLKQQIKVLLQAQRLTQRMYNSYTFTDNQMDGRQPRYAIACAAAALSMAQEATGRDLNDRLPVDLAVVTSPGVSISGTDMLREAIQRFDLSAFRT
jgi:alpha-amylase/alpha-mannosidase (GH57 family)